MWRAVVMSVLLGPLLLLGACSASPTAPEADPGTTTPESSALAWTSGIERRGDHQPSSTYSASVRQIGPRLRERMRHSHRPGCPVPLTDLRYLRISVVGFDGNVHSGEMVVHKDYAAAVAKVFEELYDAHWPIQRMRLVDDFRGADDRSMAANNTSGYNCRRVAGSSAWSAHAYGAAIDVNPVQNPYVTRSSLQPPAGRRFATMDRSSGAQLPAGVIRRGDLVVRAFARIGWEWGGDWSTSKDYQHFSASG